MEQTAGTPQADGGDASATTERGPKVVGEQAADAATELYVSQEHLDRQKRFERVVQQAATAQ